MSDAVPPPAAAPAPAPAPAAPPPSAKAPDTKAPDAKAPEAPKGPDSPKPEEAKAAEPEADAAERTPEADQPGGASDRQRYIRAAQDVFGGDSIGGHKYVFHLTGGGERTAPLRRLSPTLEEQARLTFVEPKGWADLRLRFREHRIRLLRGQAGHGRPTMATRLLIGEGAEAIYQLDPRVEIGRLAETISGLPVEPGAAFLLCQPEDHAGLTGFVLQSLEYALRQSGGWLVVTVGEETALAEADLLAYLLDLPEPPELAEVLRAHLEQRVGGARTEALLTEETFRAVVAGRLEAAGASCAVAARLAVFLARDDVRPADVDRLLQQLDLDEFAIWFDGLPDLRTRCFAIALGVLDGLPFEEVAEAAQLLYERLADDDAIVLGEQPALGRSRDDAFALGAERVARLLNARLSPVDDQPGAPVGLSYRQAESARQVIERAWRGQLIHDDLLAWLETLVTVGSDQVRLYAASTAGVLASFSFDWVSRKVLHRWATGKAWRLREGAAEALRVAAVRSPGLRTTIDGTVRGWYGDRSRPLGQSTAALAYGTGLGLDDLTQPLEALWRLAMVDAVEVHIMIGRGLAWLLAEDPAGRAPGMYEVVRRCVADPKRMLAGARAFLLVANELVTIEANGVRWPSLLHVASHNESLRAPLFEMWARVLIDGDAVELARRVAHNWAALSEADPAVREAFTRTVRAVARLDPRAGAALYFFARQWAGDDELLPMPLTAHSVERVLSGQV